MGNDNGVKLAITTIRDLLFYNRLTQDENGKSIKNIRLTIPEYQRPYKWTVKNVIQLLDDITAARNQKLEVYRVGTLILHKDGNRYSIVDGQQRMISFSLLLSAFKEVDSGKDDRKEDHTEERIDFLDEVPADDPYTRINIRKNFLALQRRAGSLSSTDRMELLDYALNQCQMVVVITKDQAQAFQLFDSQNARGKKLYPHDLLKAYHLREMRELDEKRTESIVKNWEDMDQEKLAELFSDYLYRLKEWVKGNRAYTLNEHNIDKFKGITKSENYPYAQFYKGAYAYANAINQSSIPFVAGMMNLSKFQIDSPIIAGEPFFEYAKHYFEVLRDIRNNDKYEGCYVNDNEIVKTLDLPKYRRGTGDGIARLLFDTAVLLYVDRFCPENPMQKDNELLEDFIKLAFIWAYSLRAQYRNLGWQSAQNYILGISSELHNAFNIYAVISQADSPLKLLSTLSDLLEPLTVGNIKGRRNDSYDKDNIDDAPDGIYISYLHYFKSLNYLEESNG